MAEARQREEVKKVVEEAPLEAPELGVPSGSRVFDVFAVSKRRI